MSTVARFSLAEYDRMIEEAVFDPHTHARLELIRGEIREMTPAGPAHEDVLDRLSQWSYAHRPRGVRIRVQESVGLPEAASAPEPDLTWVRQRVYSRARPTASDVLLLVEVAESSLAYDRTEKAEIYAQAGIRDYWVVNVADRAIEIRREPAEGRYRSITISSGEDEVRPLAFPEIALRPCRLWGDLGEAEG